MSPLDAEQKQSLLTHPDRLRNPTEKQKADATAKFQTVADACESGLVDVAGRRQAARQTGTDSDCNITPYQIDGLAQRLCPVGPIASPSIRQPASSKAGGPGRLERRQQRLSVSKLFPVLLQSTRSRVRIPRRGRRVECRKRERPPKCRPRQSLISLQSYPSPHHRLLTKLSGKQVFTDVFDELLTPEVERVVPFWRWTGAAAGAVLGFVVGNLPGAVSVSTLMICDELLLIVAP